MNLSSLPSYPYITGDSFRGICGWVLDEIGWYRNPGISNCIFVKTDFLKQFSEQHVPKSDFILFTHNSDYGISKNEVSDKLLSLPNLQRWYAQNVLYSHPKLTPIPIGLTNRRNPHYSDSSVITSTVKQAYPRLLSVYANYNCTTNRKEREHCALHTGVRPVTGLAFGDYLRALCSHQFVISPAGNGIDCHRTWESLYCGASPIVTPYALFDTIPHLPVLVIADWREYKELKLSNAIRDSLWADFDPDLIRIDGYLKYLGVV
jgi:hypothetical protein